MGRPCGQWWVSAARSRAATKAAISSGVSRSPARTAAWQAIRLMRSFKSTSRVGKRSFDAR